ncbi:MAG: hypothetical protein D6744_11090, partial [Planctomycetota bacterium]
MRVLTLITIAAAAALAFAQDAATKANAQNTTSASKPATTAPNEERDGLHPLVKMTTTLGDIVLELNAEKAPITVDNFIQYAEDGFYEGTIFHRCIEGFMIQGGGFTPDMEEKKEGVRGPIKNEWRNRLRNRRGTIAMARTTDPDSATCQFFINVVDNQRLNMPTSGGAGYCVFGKVVEGMDVVDKIVSTEKIKHPKYPSNQAVTPKEPVVIQSVTLMSAYDRDAVKKLIAEQEARRAAVAAEQEQEKTRRAAEFKELLEKKEDKNGNKLQSTESGLQYVVLKEGDGPSPEKT